jgi:hypothetical protein
LEINNDRKRGVKKKKKSSIRKKDSCVCYRLSRKRKTGKREMRTDKKEKNNES